MIRTKEIYNDTNEQEFVSKEYLRHTAFYNFNADAIDIVKAKKSGDRKRCDYLYERLNGATGLARCMEIMTQEEKERFFEALRHCMYDCPLLTAPYIYTDGVIIIEPIEN